MGSLPTTQSRAIFNLAFFLYGIYNLLELTIWLKYLGIPSARYGDFHVLKLIPLSAVQLIIIIGGFLAIKKSRFALHAYVTAILFCVTVKIKLIFFGLGDDTQTNPSSERMFIITLAALYFYSTKQEKPTSN